MIRILKNNIPAFFIIAFCFIHMTVKSQESITAYTTYKHQIINDSIKHMRMAINQKTYNHEGVLVRERVFDSITGKQTLFSLFFYDHNGYLISKELYHIDHKPVELITYKYDTDGDTVKKSTFIPFEDTVTLSRVHTYEYDENKNLMTYKTYNQNNTLLQMTTFTYDTHNRISKKETTDKKCRVYKFKKMIFEYEYGTDSLCIKEKKYLKTCNHKKINTIIVYQYKNDRCIEKKELFSSGKLAERREYNYFNNGKLSGSYIYNSENKPVKAFSFNNSSHFIILGDIKSYWE